MIVHVPNVLSPQQVSRIRSEMAAAEWVDGRQSVGDQGAKVKNNRQLREGSGIADTLGAVVLEALRANAVFFSAALPLRISSPMFNRYEDGETYGMHVDGAVRMAPDGMTQIRTDVSCTLFLGDPESYDGGELEVADTYGSHEIKLPAGDLVLYPSTSLHRVAPVTRGVRVASFLWIQSLVRDAQQRSMLFELDQTIFKLRSQHGDSPETVSLTGHYHNLLRQWSQT